MKNQKREVVMEEGKQLRGLAFEKQKKEVVKSSVVGL